VTGRFTDKDKDIIMDSEGVTLRECLETYQAEDICPSYRSKEEIHAFLELHDEQGPYLENGNTVALTDDQLPLLLPDVEDYSPSKTGASPLEKATDWLNVEINGVKGKRETSTMPGSAGSSWYFLRYIDPHNENALADPELLKHWLPVDLYIGGPEHAVGHLLYSRMWNNFLYDIGAVPVKEPFKKLVHQGMILGANGIKMGKRFPEFVVDPNTIVMKYGADTMRVYEMFMGPLEASKPWSDQGVDGSRKWLERVWRLVMETPEKQTDEPTPALDYSYNFTVKKVTDDYASLNFNTAISPMMIFINDCYKQDKINKDMLIGFVRLLSPIAPHICEEMHQALTGEETLAYAAWPTYDPAKLVLSEVEIVVQVNGKLRAKFSAAKDAENDVLEAQAKEAVAAQLEGKTIRKVIVVKNKLVNIVAN
jgi:leucyl-tRNA synthetase